ncbi:MAG: lipid A-modifier LpxR family protein [Myxococcota bacterium]
MMKQRPWILVWLALPSLAVAQPTTRPFGEVELSTYAAHDALTGRLRHGRSHGAALRARAVWRPGHWRAGALLDELSLGIGFLGHWSARMPTNAGETQLQPYDLAPSGSLGGGAFVELLGPRDRFTLTYLFGVTGRASRGDALYRTLGETESWSHAAESEVGQNLYLTWERCWLTAMEMRDGAHLVDVATATTTALGELHIAQSLAVTMRVGWMLGPLAGTTRSSGGPWWRSREAYVYATLGVDVVARDAMIDGPLFNDSPHPHETRARPVVPVAVLGFRLRPWRRLSLGYAIELRGRAVDVPASAPTTPASGHATGRLDVEVTW